jgi:hypothetical protein
VVHATDEVVTEFAIAPYAAGAPLHVVALRTREAKYATYSHWSAGTTAALAAAQERELYDYRAQGGRLELHNSAGANALERSLAALLEQAHRVELRAPLPAPLRAARARGFHDYFVVARRAAARAARRRAELARAALGRSARRAGGRARAPAGTSGGASAGKPL